MLRMKSECKIVVVGTSIQLTRTLTGGLFPDNCLAKVLTVSSD